MFIKEFFFNYKESFLFSSWRKLSDHDIAELNSPLFVAVIAATKCVRGSPSQKQGEIGRGGGRVLEIDKTEKLLKGSDGHDLLARRLKLVLHPRARLSKHCIVLQNDLVAPTDKLMIFSFLFHPYVLSTGCAMCCKK